MDGISGEHPIQFYSSATREGVPAAAVVFAAGLKNSQRHGDG